jgi:hemolysin activation/secretion protein
MKRILLWLVLFQAVLVFSRASAADLRFAHGGVSGVTQLSEAEVRAVMDPYTRDKLSAADILLASEALNRAVRDAGAFAAKVYVWQDEQSGVVRFEVIEGHLAQDGIELSGDPARVDSRIIRNQLEAALVPGSVISASKYERAILLTNDLPGVATTQNALLPGEKVGEARFKMAPVDGALFNGNVFYDNFGSTYTGRNRLGATLEINSPLRRGDKVALGANVSDLGTVYVDLDASLPLNAQGLRFGLMAGFLNYRTDEPAGFRGESREAGVYLRYPFIRSRQLNLSGEARWGGETLEDKNDLTTITDRKVQVASLRLHGDHADSWWGGGTTTAEVEVFLGNLDLSGYRPYEALDAQTAQTAGQFSRATWRLARMQHWRGNWQSSLEFAGQIASKNMDGSQAIAFGGPYYFTGYQSGEVLGSEGSMLHADLRYNVPALVWGGRQQWSVFYNLGRISTHAVDIVGGVIVPGVDAQRYTLQSAGIGFSQQWRQVKVQGAMGQRIHNQIPDALLDGNPTGRPNFWLQLVYNY